MSAGAGAVRVAVRVRPMNKREIERNAQCVIEMHDNQTWIHDPKHAGNESATRKFTFDHSYWSFNESDSHFASQEKVFEDIGRDVVQAAFDGFNACLFAYGQTGSGKSYSMMGYGESVGLIPRICEAMFDKATADGSEVTYSAKVSYLEIYNENVRDLLVPGSTTHNLKVREHPVEGPYVESLTVHDVNNFERIAELMEVGNNNRTTAATNMNDTSSRSHSVFTIAFTQISMANGLPSEKSSKINLVDLAGSERSSATGAKGDRLREGSNINKSLTTLGLVISALADNSDDKKKKKTHVPYRDSVLTFLLKESLGGNSKTIMLAALSPADINHGETLSTLHYADRAKRIVNKPIVNEDPNVKLIRELRAEIERLKQLMGGEQQVARLQEAFEQARKKASGAQTAEEKAAAEQELQNAERALQEARSGSASMQAQIAQSETLVTALTTSWQDKHRNQSKIIEDDRKLELSVKSEQPHLISFSSSDVLASGVVVYYLYQGETRIGGANVEPLQDIEISGDGVANEQCIIKFDGEEKVELVPIATTCYVNDVKVTKPTELRQGHLIRLGTSNVFRFNHPLQASRLKQMRESGQEMPSDAAGAAGADASAAIEEQQASDADLEAERERVKAEIAALEAAEAERRQREEELRAQAEKEKEELHKRLAEMALLVQQKDEQLSAEKQRLADELTRRQKEHDERVEEERRNLALQGKLAEERMRSLQQETEEKINQEKLNAMQLLEKARRDSEALLNARQTELRRTYEAKASPTKSAPGGAAPGTPAEDAPFHTVWQISIAKAHNRGDPRSKTSYMVYEIHISVGGERWKIFRRYSEFDQLHNFLKEKIPHIVKRLNFPPKKVWPDEKFLKKRKEDLELYLVDLIRSAYEAKAAPFYRARRTTLMHEVPFFRPGEGLGA